MRHSSVNLLLLFTIAGCTRGATPPPLPPTPDPYAPLPPVTVELTPPKIVVDSLLGTLSVREKVGQVIMPWLLGNYAASSSEQFDTAAVWIDSLSIGGIIISVGSPLDIAMKLNALQRRSRLPLLIAADFEWGTGMRLRGGTAFPIAMALGATGRELDAYELGRVTALEAHAVGVQLTLSPVADINNNPNNPIINTRSFGEEPHDAARLITAYVQGAQEHGLYTTAKHFPGHGDTDADSHIDLPVVRACWNRLDSLELIPFRAAISAGVSAVMTAHVALPCFDGDDPLPATLSPGVMHGILRDSLGFSGLVVTDALNMGAIVNKYGPGESAVRAFLAGSDLLLYPADARAAVDAMVAAVEFGRITMQRLDRSVRRVLTLKQGAGLFARRTIPLDSVPAVVGHRDFQAIADDIAARALTLVQRGALDQFRSDRGPVALIIYAEETNLSAGDMLERELYLLGDTVTAFRLYPASGTLSYDSARTVIEQHPRVIFATSVRFISGRGHIAMPDSLAQLVLVTEQEKPTVVVSFGSPYLLEQLPGYGGAYLLAWSDVPATERAAAQALAGGAAITGRLPISLPDEYPRGHGVEVPAKGAGDRRIGGLETPTCGTATATPFDPARLRALGEFLEASADDGAFPGAVLAVGYRGSVACVMAAGRYGEDDPRRVSDSTIYDLASLTKVVGLTTGVMILAADGRIDLDRPASHYLPSFAGHEKSDILVRHLLTHTSGLPAWRPLHLETATRAAALQQVNTSPLEAPPGERYVYSDLGAIVLTQVVEAVAGEPLDRFLERKVFAPLGMRRTQFRPPAQWQRMIAPTERDPWRGRVLRGEVHDENAARLGGVSGHAGLFSTAPDLARFAMFMLDAYHDRLTADAPLYIPAFVVREFTHKQSGPRRSTRALGWDTPSPNGRSSAGTMLSPSSFGHTGFTGTSIWIDPERELFIVLLTNRVHPTRENTAIRKIRAMVADSVVSALLDGTRRQDKRSRQ